LEPPTCAQRRIAAREPPGFARGLDEHRNARGHLVGNNRIDSYQYIDHSGVGLLIVVPGLSETLRGSGGPGLVLGIPNI
jgi:hypothetical protein